MGKAPSFQFYPGDWLKDPALRSVSLSARGVWMDMLCLMFEASPRGYLSINGKPVSLGQLTRMVGSTEDEVSHCIEELLSAGVASRTESQMIYSRRLVRDDKIRAIRRKCGSMGGNPNLVNQNQVCLTKTQPNTQPNLNQSSNQNPTPSSSSSSSVSIKKKIQEPPTSSGPPAEAVTKFISVKDLISEGVNEKHAQDWFKVRKAKRSPLTETAWSAIKREADKVKISPADAVKIAAESGWQGFKADWIQKKTETCIEPQTRTESPNCTYPGCGLRWVSKRGNSAFCQNHSNSFFFKSESGNPIERMTKSLSNSFGMMK